MLKCAPPIKTSPPATRDRYAWKALVDAAVHRTGPVMLTVVATVLGMIPLTRSVFGGPTAIAIMGGLTIAMMLTILLVPALYAAWFRLARQRAGGPAPAGTVPALAA